MKFKTMKERKKRNCLDSWRDRASQFSVFKSCVQGNQQDFNVVYQAITSNLSPDLTEGQISMYTNFLQMLLYVVKLRHFVGWLLYREAVTADTIKKVLGYVRGTS